MGGCHLLGNFSWGSAFFHFMNRPPDPQIVGEAWRDMWLQRLNNTELTAADVWLRHQRRDEFWKHGSVCENYADIECAVYAVGGWEDGYSNAVPRMLANLQCPRKSLVGPWGHKNPDHGIPGPAIGFLQEALRWWDYWLKDEDTGVMNEPMYRVWMQDYKRPDAPQAHVPGRWVAETQWPSTDVRNQSFYLDGGALSDVAPQNGKMFHRPVQSVGAAGGEWCPYGLGGASPDLAIDQREDDAYSLVWEGPTLEQALEMMGAPIAVLEVEVDQPVGEISRIYKDVRFRAERGFVRLCKCQLHRFVSGDSV